MRVASMLYHATRLNPDGLATALIRKATSQTGQQGRAIRENPGHPRPSSSSIDDRGTRQSPTRMDQCSPARHPTRVDRKSRMRMIGGPVFGFLVGITVVRRCCDAVHAIVCVPTRQPTREESGLVIARLLALRFLSREGRSMTSGQQPEYYSFSDEAISSALEAARKPHEGKDLAAATADLSTSEGAQLEILAQCISVRVNNNRVCLSLPLGIGSICIPIPFHVGNGTVAEACISICTTWGIPTGACASIRVGGTQVVRQCFGFGC
jgi:hypothetical protein